MADEYKFPDETPAPAAKKEDDFQVEVVDDTPAEDRNRRPLGKSAEQIAADVEAEEYSDAVKKRMRELTHVAHDERRAKEAAQREQAAATDFAKRVWEENQRLQQYVVKGESTHKEVLEKSATTSLAMAKKALSAAYQSGDADKVAEATEAMQLAAIEAEVARRFTPAQLPTGQPQNFQVPSPQLAPAPAPTRDDKAIRWQARNQWFGADPELTSFALGYHKKLVDEGVDPTSDEYYQKVDSRVRQVFPEYFQESRPSTNGARSGAASIVASVGRTTGSRKVTLSLSQQAVAKKLGISNEQYAKSLVALENRNG
jgi:hypothetical protein